MALSQSVFYYVGCLTGPLCSCLPRPPPPPGARWDKICGGPCNYIQDLPRRCAVPILLHK